MIGCGHGHDNNGQYHFMREKTQIRCGETYVKALEEERSKIMVFQRELPLCLQLVTQAIEACKKQQLSGTITEHFHGESESCEQNISSKLGSPILEEFMPTNRSSSEDEEDHDHQFQFQFHQTENENSLQKSDWLKSVQLWNQTPDSPTNKDSTEKASAGEEKGDGSGAFKKEKKKRARSTPTATKSTSPLAPTAASSTEEETGMCSGRSKKEDKEGQRKMRRSWSPELHRRFLHALQQLGGSHVATPKQIREVMKVDGLTNDEVKSHLQKYRLHERSPTLSTQNDRHKQAPQFLVVGRIWVPPPEYTVSMVAATAPQGTSTCNEIHAPKAVPLHKQNKHQKQSRLNENLRHSEDRVVHFNSPTNFSSITDHITTTTTTVSLSF